jgi:hypothetical protein
VDGLDEYRRVVDEVMAPGGANDAGGQGEMLLRSNANRKKIRMVKKLGDGLALQMICLPPCKGALIGVK